MQWKHIEMLLQFIVYRLRFQTNQNLNTPNHKLVEVNINVTLSHLVYICFFLQIVIFFDWVRVQRFKGKLSLF